MLKSGGKSNLFFFFQSFIHVIEKYLLIFYYLVISVLGVKYVTVTKTGKILFFRELIFWWREADLQANKVDKIIFDTG